MSDTDTNISEVSLEETNVLEEDRLYTAKEMADFLGIKIGALKDWTKLEENPCPCLRFQSRVLRFEKEEVLKWFREQTKVWKRPRRSSQTTQATEVKLES
jgi:predicted site-specific integrase-resolvase